MAGLGDLVGGLLGGGGAKDSYNDIVNQTKNIPLPVLKEYYPELYKQVVSLNPELETAVNLGPSEMAGISTDPALRQAQLNALKKLQGIGDAGGRDSQFLADQAQLESDINTNTQGQMGAIQQNMAARGLSGGMSEMVARNQAAQMGANRQAQMGMEAKAQAEQRALQALMQSGQLGGQMQAQDFSQQSAKAQAADAIARFNAQNTQQVQANNVASKNNAQAANMAAAQDAANRNSATKNEALKYNLGLNQQQFNNQMAKQGVVNGGLAGKGQAETEEDQRNSQFLGGLISAGAGAYGASSGGKKQVVKHEL